MKGLLDSRLEDGTTMEGFQMSEEITMKEVLELVIL